MLNDSFLEPFQKNYEIFEVFQGALPLEYFGKSTLDDLKKTIVSYLRYANKEYDKSCKLYNKTHNDFEYFSIKKDKSGNVYMEVIGADDRTKLIIRRNCSKEEDYLGMKAYHVNEERFTNQFKMFQEKRIKNVISVNNIPSEVVDFSKFDPIQRMGSRDVADYVKYLENEYFESAEVYFYEEAESSKKYGVKHGGGDVQNYERKNDIIEFSKRRVSLVKFNPDRMVKFKSKNKDNDIISFVYKKDNYLIAFCEPISGIAWSRIIFLKDENYTDDELIDKLLKKIQMSNEDALNDKLMVNSSHTTYDRFNANLAYLLGDEDDLEGIDASYSFRKSIKEAKEKISR